MTEQYTAELATGYSSEERTNHPQGFFPYATWLKELGDIWGKPVLDLACGSGFSSRLLADKGANVIGIDISTDMIALARAAEAEKPLGIRYFVADAIGLNLGKQFGIVTPSFLFNYARTKRELRKMIAVAARHLRSRGIMVALNSPPDDPAVPYQTNANHASHWVGKPFGEGSQVRLTMYALDGRKLCSFTFYHWPRKVYEECLEAEGFRDIQWIPVEATEEGKKVLPNWRQLEERNCACILKATKS